MKKITPKEDLLTVLQICNEHKLIGRNRRIVEKIYKGQEFTEIEWIEKLKVLKLL